MSDMYETLGVPRDATSADIKKAYRRQAQRHHPDKGGSEEKFIPVQIAYDVLMDPLKRQHYDKTGEVPEPNNEEVQILSRLAQLFSTILDQPTIPGDTVLRAASMVADSIRTVETNVADAIARVEALERRRNKIVNVHNTIDIYANIVNERITQGHQTIAQMQSELTVLHGVRLALDDYEDKDPGPIYRDIVGTL